jgi:WD40 repeat protein
MRQDAMIREIAISTDGRTLVTGSWSGGPTVQIWDAASQEPLGLPTALPNGVTAVALSPDGRLLVSACMSESFAQAWELATPIAEGQPGTHELLAARFQLKHEGPVRSVVFSRDGRRIVTGSYDGTAQQWDAASGQRIGEPLRIRGQVGAVAYSRDSRYILTGTDEGQAQLWHADTSRPAGLPLKHDGTVRGVAFSPDGQLLATASWDKTARLWHAATRKPVGPAMRHGGEVESVTFSPDGRTVVTSSWDTTARFWPVVSPIETSIDEVVRWVETLTGMALDASEAAQVLDADSWKARRDRLSGSPGRRGSAE